MTTLKLQNKTWTKLLENDTDFVLEGKVTIDAVNQLVKKDFGTLDLSKAKWIIDEETFNIWMGMGHYGGVYRKGKRNVETIIRLLEKVSAVHLILPDDIARRHINVITQRVRSVEVGPNCKLFSMKDGHLCNKKGTTMVIKNDIL